MGFQLLFQSPKLAKSQIPVFLDGVGILTLFFWGGGLVLCCLGVGDEGLGWFPNFIPESKTDKIPNSHIWFGDCVLTFPPIFMPSTLVLVQHYMVPLADLAGTINIENIDGMPSQRGQVVIVLSCCTLVCGFKPHHPPMFVNMSAGMWIKNA